MCCFSGNVESVTGTQLFARALGGGRQVLVYTMSLAADADLAMILPLPVPRAPAEDAVRFIDLPFDHTLYFQGDFLDREQADARPGDGSGYATSPCLARETVDLTRAAGIVDGDTPFRRLRIHGMATNGDTFVTPRPGRAAAGRSVSSFFRHLKFW